MSKKVVWTSLASNSLSDIHDYYSLRASTTVANRIVRRILGESSKLLSNPQIGQIEIFLKGRQFEYRYLVVGNYKLIYRVSEKSNAIVILDVFDTRRNPGKMSVEED